METTMTLDEETMDKLAMKIATILKEGKQAPDEEFWGNREVAEYYGVTTATVMRWYKEGILPDRNKAKKWPAKVIKKHACMYGRQD